VLLLRTCVANIIAGQAPHAEAATPTKQLLQQFQPHFSLFSKYLPLPATPIPSIARINVDAGRLSSPALLVACQNSKFHPRDE
jgi:hypothetical protein